MATQKPTVIVKDNKTAYPFDTGPNRYIEYPRSLRHPDMEKFKKELVKSLRRTIDQGKDKSFIGHLGPFVVPDVKSTTLPASDIIIDRLESLERRISETSLEGRRFPKSESNSPRIRFKREGGNKYDVCLKGFSKTQIIEGVNDFKNMMGEEDVEITTHHVSARHAHVVVSGEITNSTLFRSDFSTAIEDAIPF